jgi:hypothetical protein
MKKKQRDDVLGADDTNLPTTKSMSMTPSWDSKSADMWLKSPNVKQTIARIRRPTSTRCKREVQTSHRPAFTESVLCCNNVRLVKLTTSSAQYVRSNGESIERIKIPGPG